MHFNIMIITCYSLIICCMICYALMYVAIWRIFAKKCAFYHKCIDSLYC